MQDTPKFLTHRPSREVPRASNVRKFAHNNTEIMEERFAQGLDLFTGLPLQGKAAEEWLRVRFGDHEEDSETEHSLLRLLQEKGIEYVLEWIERWRPGLAS